MRCGRVSPGAWHRLGASGEEHLRRVQNEASVLNETVIEVVQMTCKSVEMNRLNIGAPESRGGGTVAADLGAAK
ncbi:uncharacterized protein MONOS_8678 [Monocercomonoides exilis]|uniref:uncharacterized protein n=1 Tax=Monocercomonoides exilis TaxID=2049356 RepID=UPI003559C4FB|nr:hypothetical protein MONOS_8678 [Monocercomonoides exilis]|eukprot:MONOS_8678.1-p1 / transcript=MONOS_8678.1 / gene=MONOS_8678 / organism=Monocercomonoides_exilis_PA203 / gene_product=unspecified product / transcript_product=unspecified product / location=Mono_scaffold00334:4079-4300(+) / protein_length=74 / sequence_SO=supercontig / SO=protein_coding / is_pseudo=false